VLESLNAAGVRAQADLRNEKLGYKIREAQLKKIPYMLVVGKREVAERGVSPRRRDGKDLGLMPLGDTVDLIAKEGAFPETGRAGG
jgi:threonyl-tRNA synthetase